jgi:hypothetical protein
MASIRQQIIDILDIELKKIKKANGFNTDAGKNVFAWRDNPLTKPELPGLIYRDALNRKFSVSPIGKFRWALRIEVAVFGTSANEVRAGLEDVLKVIGICEETKWGNNAQDTLLADGDEMAVEKYDIETGAAILTFEVVYDTNKWSM